MEVFFEPLVITGLVALVALLLVIARQKYPDDAEAQVIQAINNCLPQTQCAQCGHPGCLPYATAISEGEPINRCPPGGADTIAALADLLGQQPIPLDPEFGREGPQTVAVIREAECIGCTLCIQACPVDAIVGAQQLMHSVIPDVCTGCDLCLPPCPVDCIDMVEVEQPTLTRPKPKPIIAAQASACIQCGDCEQVCPKDLSPQNLLWQKDSYDAMQILKLDDCIECRLCDRVCPSAIPLTSEFIDSKLQMAKLRTDKIDADLALARFEQRNKRIEKSIVKVKTSASSSDRAALLARLRK